LTIRVENVTVRDQTGGAEASVVIEKELDA
jgi:hypothetical protein